MERRGVAWFQRFYKWLSLLLAISFVVIGSGILLKLLLPEPLPISGIARWVMGGLILAYGIARLIVIYVKSKREKETNATFKSM
jgi:hypothetical protein